MYISFFKASALHKYMQFFSIIILMAMTWPVFTCSDSATETQNDM